MSKLGFYVNLNMCSGCRTCQIACKDKNNLDVGALPRWVTTYQTGKYPNATYFHVSTACNHCENPACLAACAKGAIYKLDDGPVLIDAEMCDGCQACVEICPYHAPQYVEETGKVVKCDTCVGLRANGNQPACVASCLMRCLDFGDVDELKAKYGDDLVDTFSFLADPSMTKPTTLHAKCEKAEGELRELFW